MTYAELMQIVAQVSDGAGDTLFTPDSNVGLMVGDVRVARRSYEEGEDAHLDNLGLVLEVYGLNGALGWEFIGFLIDVTLTTWEAWNHAMIDRFDENHQEVLTAVPSFHGLPQPILRSADDEPYVTNSEAYDGNTELLMQLANEHLQADSSPLWCDSRGYLLPAGHPLAVTPHDQQMGGIIQGFPETVRVVSPNDIPTYIEIV